jgi:hypothetical protein
LVDAFEAAGFAGGYDDFFGTSEEEDCCGVEA